MLKKVDIAVYETIKSVKENTYKPGVNRFSLKDGGVDWALDENNQKLWSAAEIEKMNQIKKTITTGKVTVPDYYKTK